VPIGVSKKIMLTCELQEYGLNVVAFGPAILHGPIADELHRIEGLYERRTQLHEHARSR
jgi:hypothetical protein